ncbi:TPA: hypothetical protein N0F65_006740 [Lagenidium giganteum]|uniref:BZIP domain-containing protein n=1 Tax=Lagenidium giganteum TaxID=4803 RepID=A0AAV2YZX5_9STRA|nr:TPA: hypothetical protein N0F65_006740 [Lagenidium giganteum]
MSTAMSTTAPGQNAMKRSLSMTSASPSESPTVSVASSMIAMRNHPDALDLTQSHHHPAPRPLGMRRPSPAPTPPPHAVSQAQPSYGKSEASAGTASAKPAGEPPVKKMKVSRERQLKINAASRRCRKKQKLELHFLRTHVVELQSVLRDQIQHLRNTENHQPQDPGRIARLSAFLDESLRKVEEVSSGMRPPAASKGGNPDADVATSDPVHDDEENSYDNNGDHCLETNHVKSLDPMTEYSLNDERKRYLLHIARFMRTNITLESHSFSPDTISCLPIEMDGWQLRLAITAKNYTIHNSKFFPCNLMDMYEFCWETNVSQKMSIKQGKKHYCVVTPLDKDVAHVYSKTIGRWSLSVHGVENVSYNSLVCRVFDAEHKRAIICQQSVLEDKDLRDENTIPWLFKRWVVFKPQVVNGVEGTMVEAFRTASYATGRPIYKENNTYESFCEHLIRRYAESNALLERMMARDKRFMHVAAIDVSNENDADRDMDETASDRMVKDLLLF